MHSDYAFIDIAVGNCNRRNNVIRIDELNVASSVVDAYCSMFRFKQEYQQQCATTGSVKGANKFKCYSDFLWFDIDSNDLESALLDAQSLVRGFASMGVLDGVVIFFSGSKGMHIGIASVLFGFVPSVTLPDEMRSVALQLASLFNITIDNKIYNANRMWRLPNTQHSKTKFYKTQLATSKFAAMSLEEIQTKAAKPNNKQKPAYLLITKKLAINERLEALRKEAIAGRVQKAEGWEAPIITGKRLQIVQTALDILLATGVTKGNRDNEGLLRASECRKSGLTQDECFEQLIQWNALNHPPMSNSDLTRITNSAFVGAGYDFGMNCESLAVARKQAEHDCGDVETESDGFFDAVEENDEELSARHPYSLEELTANGMPEPPEPVGEWLSWRGRITLVVGREKTSGKSTLCTWEALACLKKGGRVLWISPDEPRNGIILRFEAAGAMQYKKTIFVSGDANVPQSWNELRDYVLFVKPDLLILDSIHSVFPLLVKGKLPDNSDAAVWQGLITKLRPAAIKHNMAVIWIHHANKATGVATGSIGITAGVDAIITITPLLIVKTEQAKRMRKLSYLGRHVGPSMDCTLEYLGDNKGYKRWDFKEEEDAEDDEDTQTQVEMIAEWLVDFLQKAEHPVRREDVQAAFKTQFSQVSDSLLDKTRAALCKARIVGTKRVSNGKTNWFLKQKSTKAVDLIDGVKGTDNEK